VFHAVNHLNPNQIFALRAGNLLKWGAPCLVRYLQKFTAVKHTSLFGKEKGYTIGPGSEFRLKMMIDLLKKIEQKKV
jgi:hypothetical protein